MAARFLALGDSYTIGEGVPEAGRWPVQLVAALAGRGLAVDDPRIVAVTGWTTDELAAGMDAAELSPAWDLVSLLIGVNNQYRGRDEQEYRRQFDGLLARAIALAGDRPRRVVVVSIPDWGVTRFGRDSDRDTRAIAAALDRFNAIARAAAASAGAAFVDITDLSRAHPEELAGDGLHPDARQYARWCERIAPVAGAALAA
ncbi:MAG TPA: GDSL-type esterase/lipase family protein [Dyella sp.]|nr:GDSL-type esterase/lipase family protein [Dyella sp.]